MPRQSRFRKPLPRVRRFELALGLVVLLAGVFYLFVGIPWYPTTGGAEVSQGHSLALGVDYPYSLSAHSVVLVQWTATTPTTVLVQSCGSDSTCSDPSPVVIASGRGTSGSLSFTATRGTYYALTPSGTAHIAYQGETEYPFFYLALPVLFAGLIFIALSVIPFPLGRGTSRTRSRGKSSMSLTERKALESLLPRLEAEGVEVAVPCATCQEPVLITSSSSVSDLRACQKCQSTFDSEELVDFLSLALE